MKLFKLLEKISDNPIKASIIVMVINLTIYAGLFIGALLIVKWIFFSN